jgi:hypothetical protein
MLQRCCSTVEPHQTVRQGMCSKIADGSKDAMDSEQDLALSVSRKVASATGSREASRSTPAVNNKFGIFGVRE